MVRRNEKSFLSYSLPNDYKSASFDYNVLSVRRDDYISLILKLSDYSKIVEENIIKYIEFENGSIYQMDRMEMPLIYAAKAKPIDPFKTLKIYKTF